MNMDRALTAKFRASRSQGELQEVTTTAQRITSTITTVQLINSDRQAICPSWLSMRRDKRQVLFLVTD